jgi:cobalt-zinc-cadmium efflux system outer membrane protein
VAREAQLSSARRGAVPDLQLLAGIQQNRQLLEPEVSNTYRVGLQGFVTAAVNLPIFNRSQGNTAAARAELAKAHEEVTRVQLLLRRPTQPLLQAYLTEQVEAERYKGNDP